MWKRNDLKEKAKAALTRNYWKAILVSALLIILGDGVVSAASFGGSADSYDEEQIQEIGTEMEGATFNVENVADTAQRLTEAELEDIEDTFNQINESGVAVYVAFFSVIFIFVIIIIAVAFIINFFVANPARVGAARFMLKSTDDKGNISELGYAFDHGYKNTVKTEFICTLQIFLWSLLFIIPGIYKHYQYYLVDYILAENPGMQSREVLELSKNMMNGHKWKTFVLDLSFILWHMLGMVTCGLAEIFYVKPYVYLTRASLYRALADESRQ